jgi:hypothetical protein
MKNGKMGKVADCFSKVMVSDQTATPNLVTLVACHTKKTASNYPAGLVRSSKAKKE